VKLGLFKPHWAGDTCTISVWLTGAYSDWLNLRGGQPIQPPPNQRRHCAQFQWEDLWQAGGRDSASNKKRVIKLTHSPLASKREERCDPKRLLRAVRFAQRRPMNLGLRPAGTGLKKSQNENSTGDDPLSWVGKFGGWEGFLFQKTRANPWVGGSLHLLHRCTNNRWRGLKPAIFLSLLQFYFIPEGMYIYIWYIYKKVLKEYI
jgi:hypothetical protein